MPCGWPSAADGTLKRQVALKLPHLNWARNIAERMARERDILATLEHPNIARLYDAGVDAMGRPWLALEYVQGHAIDVFARERSLDVRARLDLLLQVCSAVAYAHSRLVIHRDLKPSNILVTDEGQVRLLDFGIAKLLEGERTEETALTREAGRALTLDYASPEQIRGEPLTTASDVYSLGVVAYELLAGSRPYRLRRGTAAELEEAIESVDPPRASELARNRVLRRQLTGDLDAILNKALKKKSSQRYASVEALALDLRRFVDHQPVQARPDRLGYRAGKFVSRHRVQVAVGALAAAALTLGAAVASWQAGVARQQARRADQVKNLVLSIFLDADPEAGAGRSTTALDLLKQAQERLAVHSPEDPAVATELLGAVGASLMGLGDYAGATSVLESAERLAVQRLGEGHAATAAARLALGEALIHALQPERALSLLVAAETDLRRHGDIAGVAHALNTMAGVHIRAGRRREALAASEAALPLAEQHLARSHPRELMNAYATRFDVLSATGLLGGRLDAARKGYAVAREIYGERMTSPLLSMRFRYAYSLSEEGSATAGLAEMKSVLEQRLALLGETHVEIFLTRLLVGHGSMTVGDPIGAADHYRAALAVALRISGGRLDHNAAVTRLSLARPLRWRGALTTPNSS